jgi:riboflavin synthase
MSKAIFDQHTANVAKNTNVVTNLTATANGTSLTVNDVSADTFKVNLISHTKDNTTWNDIKVGDKINLEIDTLARYVARLEDVRNSK